MAGWAEPWQKKQVVIDELKCYSPGMFEECEPEGSDEKVEETKQTETTAKRPYKKPVLQRLGSVRELTMGQTMGIWADGGTGRSMMSLMM